VDAEERKPLLELVLKARERLAMDRPWEADAVLQELYQTLSGRPTSKARERLWSRGFNRGR